MLSPHRGRPCWIPRGLLLAAPPARCPPCHPPPGLGPEAHLPGLRMAESDSPRLLTGRTPGLVRMAPLADSSFAFHTLICSGPRVTLVETCTIAGSREKSLENRDV